MTSADTCWVDLWFPDVLIVFQHLQHGCPPSAGTTSELCVAEGAVIHVGAGEVRIGIFAREDIPAGVEVTYDYMFQHHGLAAAAAAYRCALAGYFTCVVDAMRNATHTLASLPEQPREIRSAHCGCMSICRWHCGTRLNC